MSCLKVSSLKGTQPKQSELNAFSVRPALWLVLFCWCTSACADHHGASPVPAISATLDAFHAAAARGDKAAYLGLMTEDGVFLGTDEWERWPLRPDFTAYVDSRFKDGKGWVYRSVDQNIQLAPGGQIGWFDEVVLSEQHGRFRGTGVVVREDGGWKIAHYALSFLIFNEDWEAVVERTKKTRAAKEANGG